jgi:hypothetical protein
MPPSATRGPVSLTEVCVEAVLKASPILPTPLDIQSVPSSATKPFRMALSSRKASWLWSRAHRGSYCDAPSVSQLLQVVSEEL